MFFCFDAEGTLWESGRPVPGAAEFLAFVEVRNWPYVVLTNTVSRDPSQLSQAWARQGLKVPAWRFVTPFDALNRFLEQQFPDREGSFRWVGSRHQARRLARQPSPQNPNWVILGDIESFSWNLKYLNLLVNDLRQGARLATLSPSLFYAKGSTWRLDTGCFVRLLEPFVDTPPLVLGKPNPLLIEAARHRLGVTGPLCIVGDDVETDVQLARSVGSASLLLRQGKYKLGDEYRLAPTWCATNLEEAGQFLERWGASQPEP